MRQELTAGPLFEGDFVIYSQAVPLDDGLWATYYWIDYCPDDGPVKHRAVQRRRFGEEAYDNAEFALGMGIGAARYWLETVKGTQGS